MDHNYVDEEYSFDEQFNYAFTVHKSLDKSNRRITGRIPDPEYQIYNTYNFSEFVLKYLVCYL